MKTIRHILLIGFALVAQAFVLSSCANTAHGVSQDYHRAEDKVENAVK